MARYNKDDNTLIFASEESEGEYCPSCGAQLDLKPPSLEDGELVQLWDCPACELKGKAYCNAQFDRHVVDLSGANRAELLSNTIPCLNEIIRIGDYVLPVIGDIVPCTPGQVIAIDLTDNENCDSDSRKDTVYVDFSVFSNEFCEEASIDPDCLIKITDATPETMKEIIESKENAMRYALRIMQSIVPWPWWQKNTLD